jgi:WD40 repeat protein
LRPLLAEVVPVGGALERTIAAPSGIDAVQLSADESMAIAVVDGAVLAWDVRTGELVHSIVDTKGTVDSICLTPSGTLLVLAKGRQQRSAITEWQLTDGRRLRSVDLTKEFSEIAVSGDGRWAIAVDGGTVAIWDVDTFGLHREIKLPDREDGRKHISSARLDHAGTVAFAAGWEGVVLVIEVGSGAVASSVASGSYGQRIAVLAAQSGFLVQGAKRHSVIVVDAATSSIRAELMVDPDLVNPITALDGQQSRVVAGTNDGSLIMWNSDSAEPPAIVRAHSARVTSLDARAPGRVLTGSSDGTLRLWRLDRVAGSAVGPVAATVGAAAIAPNGDAAITITPAGAQVWRLSDRTSMRQIRGGAGWTRGLHIFRDGRRFATIATSGDQHNPAARLRVHDLRTGRRLRELGKSSDSSFLALAVSPDDKVAVTSFHIDGGQDHVYGVEIWDLATGNRLATAFDEQNPFFAYELAFASDGKHVLSVDRRQIHVWTHEPIALVSTYDRHQADVTAVAVTGNGLVLSADGEGTISLWTLGDGQVATLRDRRPIAALCVTPSGEFAATGGRDGFVAVWDVPGRRDVARFGFDMAVTAVGLSPAGDTLVVGDESGNVHFLAVERG